MEKKRIISLVPSLTQTLASLGYTNNIVGCTQYCSHPSKELFHIPRIGGTKNPDIEKILQLKPSHIFMNQEENRYEDYDYLNKRCSVITTNPQHPLDVPKMLEDMSKALDSHRFSELAKKISIQIKSFKSPKKKSKSLYFIWKKPWMVASQKTYIGGLFEMMGYSLEPHTPSTPYPSCTLEEAFEMNIESIFLSSEPWPFRKRDIENFEEFIQRGVKIHHANGILTSWHGISTLDGLVEAQKWMHNKKNNMITEWC